MNEVATDMLKLAREVVSEVEKVERTIKFKRNGKVGTMKVEVSVRDGMGWVRKAGGGKFFGTTGYLSKDGKTIRTYSRKILAEDVEGLEDIL